MTRKFFFHLILIERLALGLVLVLTACAPRTTGPAPAYPPPPGADTISLTHAAESGELPAYSSPPVDAAIEPAVTSVAAAVPAAPAPMGILANQGWQGPFEFLHPGDKVDITATGAWSHDPADPQFSTLYGPGGVQVFDPGALLPTAPVGSLIGRIGDNPPFVVGEHLALTSTYRGQLWLAMNDNPAQISDNTGSVGAAILFIRKPPVPGLLLKSTLDGYSLVYPPGYSVVITENGIWITSDSATLATLEIRDVPGQTVDQVTDSILPKNDLNFQVGLIDHLRIEDEPATRVDLGTPDGSLILVTIVHQGRVYIWRFGPVQRFVSDPGDGVYSSEPTLADKVDELYDTVINSFEFLP